MIHNVGVGYREPRRIETVDGLPHVFAINVVAPCLPGATHSIGRPLATTAITGCALAIQPSSRRRVAIGFSGELIVLATTIAGKPSPNQRPSSKGI